MSINFTNQSESIVKRAVQLACWGNPNDAIELLQPLGPSSIQKEVIVTIFEEAMNSTDAPNLQKHVLSVLNWNPEKKVEPTGSPLLDLPAEGLFNVLSAMDFKSIHRCAQVCQFLYQSTQHGFLYQKIYERSFPLYYPANYLPLDFYQACKKGYNSQQNFLSGVYSKDDVRPPVSVASFDFTDGLLCKGLFNGEIQVWDMRTLDSVAIFQAHKDEVHLLSILDDKLCSTSYDDTVKIWNPKTGECLNAFECAESFSSFCILNEQLYAGSCDGPIRVWDLKTGESLKPFTGHRGEVSSLAQFHGMLVSCSFDGKIKFWDPNTGNCLRTFSSFKLAAINSFAIFEGKLYGGCSNGLIMVWDLKSGQQIYTLQGHRNAVFSLVIFDGKLCSSDGVIKIWGLETEEPVNIPTRHHNNPCALTFFDGQLWSGAPESGITIFDFTAEHSVVLAEIATLFRSGFQYKVDEALTRFKALPAKAKNKVYDELNRLSGAPSDDIERAWLNASSELKAKAIENYLESSNACSALS